MVDRNWNISDPAAALLISGIPAEDRGIKDQVATRIDIEHTPFTTTVDSDDTDIGALHKTGSARVYYQAGEPMNAPDSGSVIGEGTATGLTDVDADSNIIGTGRLWVDTNDNDILYVYSGSAWAGVTINGMQVTDAEGDGSTKPGDVLALLKGRTGGQTLLGGTGDDDSLDLGGSSHANEGPINVIAADTTLVELNEVPVHSLKLGEDMSGASTDGTDGAQIKAVKTASAAYDVLTKGVASIVAADVSATGGVPRVAWAKVTVNAGSTLTKDIGFAPDLIVMWNDRNGTAHPVQFWMAGMGGTTIKAGGVIESDPPVTVSSQTLSFPGGKESGNHTDASNFYYFAVKFNAAEQDPT